MAKRSITSKSRGSRLRALPWAALLQGAMVVGRRWRSLSEKERATFAGLVRGSGGRPGNLSAKEREELRRLAGKLDLKGMVRELVLVGHSRRGRRRGRGRRP